MRKGFIFSVILALVLVLPGLSQARVQGPCADCHTMHNSQNGAAVVSGGPYRALTKGDCVGCHTGGPNTGTNNIPYVNFTSAPTYGNFGIESGTNTLAGGNFYWVAQGSDAKGHNVSGIASQDGAIGLTPPGWNNTDFQKNGAVANGEATWSQQLTCAGTYGCHGDHQYTDDFKAISGAHHTDDSTIDGSTVGKSFRFLKGIKGIEDSDWEYQPTSTAHNQYYAVDRIGNFVDDPSAADPASINYLCAECHGNFHSGTGNTAGADDEGSTVGSPWIRHPSDFDMNNVSSKEYGQYPGPFDTAGTYWPGAPVGSTDLSGVKSTVLQAADDAIVLCISCHRAHGTPNDDLLRWDYTQCNASSGSSGNCGCYACHTTKY
ncbi:cytochrome c3 family protein [Thermosulfuriphilus ammonigenes]|uniref:Cytochrome c3 family protein n=1 Tax=Thermosulfuriphilus ammonigenes TaxID=1936021 RepID=A0A6G7PY16_9BACT|nr:cytochrome c3 family protein [Thermosulfuriphilus ammonigenes]MBA2849486.1 hypothetical protein [Thermosulfuriphilus ammonigenes]QIJ72552.1 cytochrome c3 family protein [Thermosulfuriphilus ammonigenes]